MEEFDISGNAFMNDDCSSLHHIDLEKRSNFDFERLELRVIALITDKDWRLSKDIF